MNEFDLRLQCLSGSLTRRTLFHVSKRSNLPRSYLVHLLGRQGQSAKELLGIPPLQTGSICQGATWQTASIYQGATWHTCLTDRINLSRSYLADREMNLFIRVKPHKPAVRKNHHEKLMATLFGQRHSTSSQKKKFENGELERNWKWRGNVY